MTVSKSWPLATIAVLLIWAGTAAAQYSLFQPPSVDPFSGRGAIPGLPPNIQRMLTHDDPYRPSAGPLGTAPFGMTQRPTMPFPQSRRPSESDESNRPYSPGVGRLPLPSQAFNTTVRPYTATTISHVQMPTRVDFPKSGVASAVERSGHRWVIGGAVAVGGAICAAARSRSGKQKTDGDSV